MVRYGHQKKKKKSEDVALLKILEHDASVSMNLLLIKGSDILAYTALIQNTNLSGPVFFFFFF